MPTGTLPAEIKLAEQSLQFSDNPDQIRHDCKVIFSRGDVIIFGTEAGAGGKVRPILIEEAHNANYRIHVKGDTWVAVYNPIIAGNFKVHDVFVMDSEDGFGHHSNRYVTGVKFDSIWPNTKIAACAGHYLTRGRSKGEVNYQWNTLYTVKLGQWTKEFAIDADIVLYGGDQNIVDRNNDTFRGQPYTSCWDHFQRYPGTGHGNIDVIALLDRCKDRLEWVRATVLDDSELFLHTDHFHVQAVVTVLPKVVKVKKGSPTTRVVKNLRKRGVKVYGRKRCLIFDTVYQQRRKTHPHHIIWNGDNDRKDDRVDTLWAHISVTKAVGISIGSCMRTLHSIGKSRFGSGVSYNFAIHHRTGEVGVGMPLDAKGTHTVMRVPRPNFSTDQNAVALAIVFIGMPGMAVSQAAWESYENIVAALIEEGFLTLDFDHLPHHFADPGKSCPTQVVIDKLPELKRGGLAKVRNG